MAEVLDVYDIYEQNLNFLFGAGASYGLLPTLALKIRDSEGKRFTFETLAKYLDENKLEYLYALLFMYYYKKCIFPGLPGISKAQRSPAGKAVIRHYKKFLTTLIALLEKQDSSSRKCNLYTTNYDSCFEVASDELLSDQSLIFTVNDGSSGFQRKTFHTKNFNNRIIQKGIFDRHSVSLVQLNLLHLHGSVFWKKEDGRIEVDYGETAYDISFDEVQTSVLESFRDIVEDSDKSIEDLIRFNDTGYPKGFKINGFWQSYNKIPIVNPTKWKFHETVFEEAYYQILRHLSFELERPNSVLVTFGFSFSDEHILHLVQRSLSNPTLTVYVSCFNNDEMEVMQTLFKGYNNVKYIGIGTDLNFGRFNRRVFKLKRTDV